jgi:DNA-binding transcriptional ArsR family regulator
MTPHDAQARLRELQAVIEALAHPARRQILLVLRFRGGTMAAGEIAARFHHTWATTTRHLRVLEKSGLLVQEKRGRSRVYRVETSKLQTLKDWLGWLETGQAQPEQERKDKGRKDKDVARTKKS